MATKKQPASFSLALPPLHEGRPAYGREACGQARVFRSKARFKVVCCGRRWGKTHLGVLMCIAVAARGGQAWWIGPTYPVAMIGWRLLKTIVQVIPGIEVKESEHRITLPNGGVVQIKSADKPDLLRGESLDFVVFDEVADIKEEAWFEGIRPALADRKGSALFIGTPRGMDNWFFTLFERARKDTTGVWEAFTAPTVDNPHIDPSEVEEARNDMHPIIFNQEHLAEFIVAGGTVFNAAWEKWATLVGDQYAYDTDAALVLQDDEHLHEACALNACVRFATTDLAVSLKTSADYTVISSWARTPGGRLVMLGFDRRRMEGPDIIPAIARQAKLWRLAFVGIEKSAFQLSIVQGARRAGLPVRELVADKDKLSRAYTAAAHMQGGRIWYRRAVHEMDEFAGEVRNFPLAAHDDCTDTVSYAAAILSRVRIGPQLVSW